MFVGGRTWQAKKINDRSTFVWPANNNNNNNNKDYISIFIFSVLSPGLLFLNYGLIRLLNYYTCTINKPYWYNPGGGGGGGGGGGRDEVWDRETMFSQLAKRSPCVMASGLLQHFSKKRTGWGNLKCLKNWKKIISCIFVLLAYRICLSVLKLRGKLKRNRVRS